jgi:hypothetical protein
VTIDVVANDSDPDGFIDPTTVSISSAPSNGTTSVNPLSGVITYAPNHGFSGSDAFDYSACDNDGDCASATVTITVAANVAPVCADASGSAGQDAALVASVACTDAEGDSLTYSVSGSASHGVVVMAGDGSFTYTPTTGYAGPDSFTFAASEALGTSLNATYSITVSAAVVGPTANPDTGFAIPGIALVLDVLANDNPGSGALDPASVTITGGPSHGTASVNPLTGALAYAASSDNAASDSLTYRVCAVGDPTLCSSATVAFTLDRAPVFPGNDANQTVHVVVGRTPPPLAGTDPDGDVLSYSVVNGNLPGSLTLNPDGTFSGDTKGVSVGNYPITISACDPSGMCTTITYTIVVEAATAFPDGNTDPIVSASQPMADLSWFLLASAIASLLMFLAIRRRAANGAFGE